MRLRWAVAEVPATVRNYSKGGALLEIAGAPPRGTLATVIPDSRELPVTIVWGNATHAAVRFAAVD